MSRMKSASRTESLREAALLVAGKVGVSAVTRELIAHEGGVSAGLVSRLLGDMATVRQNIILDGCEDNNLQIIIEGVLRKNLTARKAAKAHKDAIVAWLFK